MQIPDIAHFKSGLYLLLLNNKEFRFFSDWPKQHFLNSTSE
jgi:hypothetical protein